MSEGKLEVQIFMWQLSQILNKHRAGQTKRISGLESAHGPLI